MFNCLVCNIYVIIYVIYVTINNYMKNNLKNRGLFIKVLYSKNRKLVIKQ